MTASFPATRTRSCAEQGGRGRSEVEVVGVELGLVGRRVRLAKAQAGERELEHAVAEIGRPVPVAVASVDQQAATARLDDRAAPREDRRVALVAGRRDDHAVPVGAQRVEDPHDPSARPGEECDVALVGRSVSVVAARRRDHVEPVDVEGRAELLAGRVARDSGRPRAGGVLAAVGERELVDQAVGRGGVDETTVGVGDRGGRRDRRSPGPASRSRAG